MSRHYSLRQEQFLTDKDRNEHGEFGPEWQPVAECSCDLDSAPSAYCQAHGMPLACELKKAQETPLDYAQIIASLAFLTDEQRAGFFALVGASYCLECGSVKDGRDRCTCGRVE